MSEKREYEIGKGKPPKHTQFKKGQSGNPKGRPKANNDVASALQKVLDRKVTVQENGERKKIDYLEAILFRQADRALKGTSKDLVEFFKVIARYAPSRLEAPKEPEGFIIQYVLPDGKTMEDYENQDAFGNPKKPEHR